MFLSLVNNFCRVQVFAKQNNLNFVLYLIYQDETDLYDCLFW